VIRLVPAVSASPLRDARTLFLEYAASLGFDLCFQGFDREVAELPGAYAPPGGTLLLAMLDEQPVGCVALRALEDGACELKRLYVRPGARGRGVGRLLCGAVIAAAQSCGYARVRLDTLPQMTEAIALYRALGFGPAEPYRYNPLPGAMFMELALESRRSEPGSAAGGEAR
jgi:putative acetyltransferase